MSPKAGINDPGTLVRRSWVPLRIVISRRDKSTSFTGKHPHAIRRIPVPYNKCDHKACVTAVQANCRAT